MGLFCLATFFGGMTHAVEANVPLLKHFIDDINSNLPSYLNLGSARDLFIRLWFLTFIFIGATEYYFMHIFLHPAAQALNLGGMIRFIQGVFLVFCLSAIFTYDYAVVLIFHLFSHFVVIAFSLYLVFQRGLQIYLWLVGLCLFNLAAGGLWALMGLHWISSLGLHPNDWYHLSLMAFVLCLHALLTRGRLVSRLPSLGG